MGDEKQSMYFSFRVYNQPCLQGVKEKLQNPKGGVIDALRIANEGREGSGKFGPHYSPKNKLLLGRNSCIIPLCVQALLL